jgi:hypothetical protein
LLPDNGLVRGDKLNSMPDISRRIYLDFNASTPVASEVCAAMADILEQPYGNPSSSNWAGKPGRELVGEARCRVAGLLGCTPNEVVFTSGGSEANNHALKGVFFAAGRRAIATRVLCPRLLGFVLRRLPPRQPKAAQRFLLGISGRDCVLLEYWFETRCSEAS